MLGWMLRFLFPAAGGRCRLFVGVDADFTYCFRVGAILVDAMGVDAASLCC